MTDRNELAILLEHMRELYLADQVPWILGYSGGKDSTATLQLVCMMLQALLPTQRNKHVHVISTDTRVENPIISMWLDQQHRDLQCYAQSNGLPMTVHKLRPDPSESFWVNLIGRGYPAPRVKFRWCTDRLKIQPSNAFIRSMVTANSEAILVLGTRKAESTARSRVMTQLEIHRVRDKLSPNKSLPGTLVYSPIETWSNDDVWTFLMLHSCPWREDGNKQLMALYRSASADNECPIVVDTSTPSCGASRFGCWTCTMVEQDKSLSAMVENDHTKEWLLPLREMRDRLDIVNDRHLRDFRRMNGLVQIMPNGTNIPGPYHEAARHAWLIDLLQTEAHVRRLAPSGWKHIKLIDDDELQLIQAIWVHEKGEIDDVMPRLLLQYRSQPWSKISEVAESAIASIRAHLADAHTFAFVRELWATCINHATWTPTRGLKTVPLNTKLARVARRYRYRTAEAAIGATSHQPLLFHATAEPDDAAYFEAAAQAVANVSQDSVPWVAMAVLDRLSGHGCRSKETPYIETYYAE